MTPLCMMARPALLRLQDMNAQLKRQEKLEESLADRNAAAHGRLDGLRRKIQQNT